jgi:hypothetical protein
VIIKKREKEQKDKQVEAINKGRISKFINIKSASKRSKLDINKIYE